MPHGVVAGRNDSQLVARASATTGAGSGFLELCDPCVEQRDVACGHDGGVSQRGVLLIELLELELQLLHLVLEALGLSWRDYVGVANGLLELLLLELLLRVIIVHRLVMGLILGVGAAAG